MNWNGWAAAALAATLALAASAARADDDYISPTNDRMRITMGVVRYSADTTLRLDEVPAAPGQPVIPGTVLNAEQDLGLSPDTFGPKFQVMIRAGERNRVRLDYYSLDRSGTATLTEPINFGGTIFGTETPVMTQLDFTVLELSYEYSVIHNERFELGISLGVNITSISSRLSAESAGINQHAREDLAGPAPTPGLDATWVLSKHWYLEARAQYLKANIDEINGSLGIYEFDVVYRLAANIAVSLGYNDIRADLTSDKPTQSGFLNMSAKGPQCFVRVSF